MVRKLEIPMLVNPTEDLSNHVTSGDLVPCPGNEEVHITMLHEFICSGFQDGANKKGAFQRGDAISATRVIYLECPMCPCGANIHVCKAP